MFILSEPGSYTISMHGEKVFLRTKRRHIKFKSCSKLYEMATLVLSNMDWRRQYLPDIVKEQEEDCFLQALQDFIGKNKGEETPSSVETMDTTGSVATPNVA